VLEADACFTSVCIRLIGEADRRQSWAAAPASLNTREDCPVLWRECIDYSTHSSLCALDHTVAHVLSGVHRTLRHVFRCSHRPGLNRANGNGEGENDRKQRFHSTKLFVSDGSNAPTRLASRIRA
jgi:hypothetical protein